jgi:hypothetical protein
MMARTDLRLSSVETISAVGGRVVCHCHALRCCAPPFGGAELALEDLARVFARK